MPHPSNDATPSDGSGAEAIAAERDIALALAKAQAKDPELGLWLVQRSLAEQPDEPLTPQRIDAAVSQLLADRPFLKAQPTAAPRLPGPLPTSSHRQQTAERQRDRAYQAARESNSPSAIADYLRQRRRNP